MWETNCCADPAVCLRKLSLASAGAYEVLKVGSKQARIAACHPLVTEAAHIQLPKMSKGAGSEDVSTGPAV